MFYAPIFIGAFFLPFAHHFISESFYQKQINANFINFLTYFKRNKNSYLLGICFNN
jgi:hypothetical protein